MTISFEKAQQQHEATIFSWLDQDYIKEFWDNSDEHYNDIRVFIGGRVQSSNYFNGIFSYWIGSQDKQAFSLILTSEVLINQDIPKLWKDNLSQTGKTISLDFCIGNTAFLGKGIAATTLKEFMHFYHTYIDNQVDTFFIDPDQNNSKAIHVYKKAGFKQVGSFHVENGFFDGSESNLLIATL